MKTSLRIDWDIKNIGMWVGTYKDGTKLVATTLVSLIRKINEFDREVK